MQVHVWGPSDCFSYCPLGPLPPSHPTPCPPQDLLPSLSFLSTTLCPLLLQPLPLTSLPPPHPAPHTFPSPGPAARHRQAIGPIQSRVHVHSEPGQLAGRASFDPLTPHTLLSPGPASRHRQAVGAIQSGVHVDSKPGRLADRGAGGKLRPLLLDQSVQHKEDAQVGAGVGEVWGEGVGNRLRGWAGS